MSEDQSPRSSKERFAAALAASINPGETNNVISADELPDFPEPSSDALWGFETQTVILIGKRETYVKIAAEFAGVFGRESRTSAVESLVDAGPVVPIINEGILSIFDGGEEVELAVCRTGLLFDSADFAANGPALGGGYASWLAQAEEQLGWLPSGTELSLSVRFAAHSLVSWGRQVDLSGAPSEAQIDEAMTASGLEVIEWYSAGTGSGPNAAATSDGTPSLRADPEADFSVQVKRPARPTRVQKQLDKLASPNPPTDAVNALREAAAKFVKERITAANRAAGLGESYFLQLIGETVSLVSSELADEDTPPEVEAMGLLFQGDQDDDMYVNERTGRATHWQRTDGSAGDAFWRERPVAAAALDSRVTDNRDYLQRPLLVWLLSVAEDRHSDPEGAEQFGAVLIYDGSDDDFAPLSLDSEAEVKRYRKNLAAFLDEDDLLGALLYWPAAPLKEGTPRLSYRVAVREGESVVVADGKLSRNFAINESRIKWTGPRQVAGPEEPPAIETPISVGPSDQYEDEFDEPEDVESTTIAIKRDGTVEVLGGATLGAAMGSADVLPSPANPAHILIGGGADEDFMRLDKVLSAEQMRRYLSSAETQLDWLKDLEPPLRDDVVEILYAGLALAIRGDLNDEEGLLLIRGQSEDGREYVVIIRIILDEEGLQQISGGDVQKALKVLAAADLPVAIEHNASAFAVFYPGEDLERLMHVEATDGTVLNFALFRPIESLAWWSPYPFYVANVGLAASASDEQHAAQAKRIALAQVSSLARLASAPDPTPAARFSLDQNEFGIADWEPLDAALLADGPAATRTHAANHIGAPFAEPERWANGWVWQESEGVSGFHIRVRAPGSDGPGEEISGSFDHNAGGDGWQIRGGI